MGRPEDESLRDVGGIWTTGYGHTSAPGAPAMTPNMVITEAKSEEILRADLAKLEERTDAKLEHLGVGIHRARNALAEGDHGLTADLLRDFGVGCPGPGDPRALRCLGLGRRSGIISANGAVGAQPAMAGPFRFGNATRTFVCMDRT
ncbi:glycoside hydrolase family protein [Ensifer sp. NM-2]|uniref:glycoside hydrolase family protein n=1 Tax=Ensifer TaxID=106591 RepID=UPI00352BBBB9